MSEILIDGLNKSKDRLLGIDLFRGIAAYGVVLIHGLGRIQRSEFTIDSFVSFFEFFAVPFFLTVAFYFGRKSILSNEIKTYITNRFRRIIIPYIVWSCVYLLARFISYMMGDKLSFEKLISDPMRIIFLGGASVQLYFLPMLFIGSIVAFPLTRLINKYNNNIVLIMIFFLVTFFYSGTLKEMSYNSILPEAIIIKNIVYISSVDQPLLYNISRLILMNLYYIFECLPFIAFSLFFQSKHFKDIFSRFINFLAKVPYKKIILFLFLALISLPYILPVLTTKIRISPIYYLSIPYLFFFYTLYISPIISKSKWLRLLSSKLGYLSFGIYLSHALITQGFIPIMIRYFPNVTNIRLSLGMSLFSALIIFLISAGLIYLLSLNKTLARVFLGI